MIGYLIEITLSDLIHPIKRIIQIPGKIHFKKLQDIIQIVFSWSGESEGVFYLPDGSKAFVKDEKVAFSDDIKVRSMRNVFVDKYLEQYDELFYIYRHWFHRIKLITSMIEVEENYAKVITYQGLNPEEEKLVGEHVLLVSDIHYPLALTNLLLRDPLNLKKK